MWMNLSPYPNLSKAEKIKSTTKILQKDFYSVYLTHQLWHKSRKSVSSKVIIFLIASDWCSPITITNVFLQLILKN